MDTSLLRPWSGTLSAHTATVESSTSSSPTRVTCNIMMCQGIGAATLMCEAGRVSGHITAGSQQQPRAVQNSKAEGVPNKVCVRAYVSQVLLTGEITPHMCAHAQVTFRSDEPTPSSGFLRELKSGNPGNLGGEGGFTPHRALLRTSSSSPSSSPLESPPTPR